MWNCLGTVWTIITERKKNGGRERIKRHAWRKKSLSCLKRAVRLDQLVSLFSKTQCANISTKGQ